MGPTDRPLRRHGVMSVGSLAGILCLTAGAVLGQGISPPPCPGSAIVCDLPDMDLPRDLDLPRDRDGGQAETPFRLDGEPVTSDHPDWDWYAEPIVAYPDAAACLPPAAITDTRLDVAAFQWDTRRSLDETQVCVFRLAHLLGDWRHVAAWFAQSGLRDPEPGRTRPGYQWSPTGRPSVCPAASAGGPDRTPTSFRRCGAP